MHFHFCTTCFFKNPQNHCPLTFPIRLTNLTMISWILLKMGLSWKYLLRFTHLFFGVINVDPWGITFNINVFNVYVVYLEDQIFDFAFSTHLETKFFNLSERNGSTFFHEKRIPNFKDLLATSYLLLLLLLSFVKTIWLVSKFVKIRNSEFVFRFSLFVFREHMWRRTQLHK